MRFGALSAALAALGIAMVSSAPGRAAEARLHGCMTPAQARDVLIAQKLTAPFRAAAEALRAQGGETVGLQLCLSGDIFVYDVTLFKRDGRVTHVLVDAHTGAVLPGGHGP